MITSIGDIMRESYKRGWITTRDGNISIRRESKFYITPSGVRKNLIYPENIIKMTVSDSKELLTRENSPLGKPSGELEMHRLLQTTSDFDGCRSVVHLHPTNIIAAMHAGFNLQDLANEFPEVSRYTRVGPTVRTLPVVSMELAEETFKSMTMQFPFGDIKNPEWVTNIAYDIVGQKNHGVCAIGKTPQEAFESIERLEHVCEIVLRSGVRP